MYSHNLINISNLTAVDEAYIGKTRELEEVTELFRQIKNKKDLNIKNCTSTMSEVLKINRLIEKQFNMDIFNLDIIATDVVDAYSYTIGLRLDFEYSNMREFVVGDIKSGYKFKPGNNLCVRTCMSYGMIKDPRFTPEQLTACLLHEIGHNFGDCIDNTIMVENKQFIKDYKMTLKLYIILSILTLGLTGNPFKYIGMYNDIDNKKLNKKYKKKNKKKPGSGKISAYFTGVINSIKDTLELKMIINSRTNKNTIDYLSRYYDNGNLSDNKRKAIRTSSSRISEVIADKFAGIYGYGSEFADLMITFNTVSGSREYKATKKAKPKLNKYNDDFERALFNLNAFDCHPQEVQRVIEVLKTLKLEYEKDDIDPVLKKELIYQINQIEDKLNKMCDTASYIEEVDKDHAKFNKYIYEQDPSAVDEEIENIINSELDEVLQCTEKHYKK